MLMAFGIVCYLSGVCVLIGAFRMVSKHNSGRHG